MGLLTVCSLVVEAMDAVGQSICGVGSGVGSGNGSSVIGSGTASSGGQTNGLTVGAGGAVIGVPPTLGGVVGVGVAGRAAVLMVNVAEPKPVKSSVPKPSPDRTELPVARMVADPVATGMKVMVARVTPGPLKPGLG